MPNENPTVKKTIDLTFYARVLISVAIALLVYGFYLDVGSNKLIDPVTNPDDSKKGETITTIDIHHWDDGVEEVPIGGDSGNSGNSSSGNSSSGNSSGGNSSSGNSGNSSGGNSSSGNSSGGNSSSGNSSGGNSSGGNSSSGNSGSSSGGNSSGGNSSGGNSGGNSSSGNSGGNSSGNSSGGNSSGNSGGTTPVNPPTPSTPTLEQTNNTLRNNIQNTYGITIKYGMETAGYTVGGLSTNTINSASVVNTTLNKLNSALSLYPNGFFREIKNGGIPLTLYLVDSYSEYGVTGVTDSNYSFANVSVAVAYPFEETFYHESYHYIERYIFKRGISFQSWEGYNPSGFRYGSLMRDQSFARTGSPNAYFVNDYAQTSAEEDRASTFEYMMRGSKSACFNRNMPVWNKAVAMSNAIDAALNCVNASTTEYWERHL